MTSYSAPLKRFPLVIALGVAVGAAFALTSVYTIDLGSFPPGLTERESPTYTAGTQLEVTSPVDPYYRSSVDVPVVTPATDEEDKPATTLSEQEEPGVAGIVAAANYYPYIIEGDDVRKLRERLFGPLEGEVQASAIGATTTPNRQEPGRLPFIQLVASSDSPQHAIDLAQQTAEAFIRYVRQQQVRRDIRPEQRLIIEQLRGPERTFQTGGTSMNLPLLIFVALVAVAVAVAYLLDRFFPPSPDAVGVRDDAEEDDEIARNDDRDAPLVAASRRKA